MLALLVIFVCPPSNSLTNVLLLRAREWENNSIGFNPGDLAKVHDDHDGDEGEVFVVGRSKESVDEAALHRDPWRDPFIEMGTRAMRYTPIGGQALAYPDEDGNVGMQEPL